MRRTSIHPAWAVAAVTTVALLMASAFRSTTGVLMEPIESDMGWDRAVTSGAASLNLVVYGIAAPFTAALMQVWGLRRTVVVSLVVVGLASVATIFMAHPWQLWVLWGVCIGIGTGSMALTFGTIIANRWFVAHRSVITGVFSAATAAGQVLFVPLIAVVAHGPGWRTAAMTTGLGAIVVGLLCLIFLRDRPSDVGALPVGAQPHSDHDAAHSPMASTTLMTGEADAVLKAPSGPSKPVGSAAGSGGAVLASAIQSLAQASRHWPFWVLAITFFICGWTTNGLVVTHFVPAAHDHSIPPTVAASVIGIIGVFDIAGTVFSGWLTDKYDPRKLLALYYVTRVISLLFVNALLEQGFGSSMWVFIIFYGLDWTATVPPTVELCRRHFGLEASGVVFGWIYASHMIGAGVGASISGLMRSDHGTYAAAWILAAVLCGVAGALPLTMSRGQDPVVVVESSSQ